MKKQAITLGRIGILLPIAAVIPLLNLVAGLAALVLLLMSLHYFSKAYENPPIFKKALIGFLVPIIANIIGAIIIAIGAGSAFVTMSSGGGFDPENAQQMVTALFESGITIVGGLLILAGGIIGSYYIFQSLRALAESSGVKHFKTAGLLYFIGSIGIILLGLGFIVSFVGWIFHIVAYFSIQAEELIAEQA